jgi:hypothetical protein
LTPVGVLHQYDELLWILSNKITDDDYDISSG